MFLGGIDHLPMIVSVHIWNSCYDCFIGRSFLAGLKHHGYLLKSKWSRVTMAIWQTHRTPSNEKDELITNLVLISFVYKPQYVYHIPCHTHAHHLLTLVCREEMVSFVINCIQVLFTSSGTAVITMISLHHCSKVSYTYAEASKQLMINVDCLNIMNKWVSKLAVCPFNNYWKLIGL